MLGEVYHIFIDDNYTSAEVLSYGDGDLFSTAPKHNYYCDMASDYQHYTPEEYFKVVNVHGTISDWLVGVVQESLGVLQSSTVSLVD